MEEKKTKKATTKNVDNELLKEVISKVEKQYGKGAIMRLGEKNTTDVDAISSGSLKIDNAIGIGGFPKGRIIEIYGPESSGKTTVALHAIASCQAKGGRAAFIDAEHAIDPTYAKNLGVNIDELLLSQPDSGEQGLEICEMLVKSGAIDLIVVDSVAALVPQAELNGEMGDLQVGAQARLMSKAMRKMSGAMNKGECTVIFINQLREKVGGYGNPETTPGGRALKFYSSVRLDVRKTESVKNSDGEYFSNKVTVKVVKNKVAPPFKTAQVEIVYGEGISYISELLDLAVEFGIVLKAGSWFSYNEEKLGQGKENAKAYLTENKEIFNEIEQKVLDTMKNAS